MRRLLLLLVFVLVVAGCGGDDETPETASADDPVTLLPPGLPFVLTGSTDFEGEQWKAALAFAEQLDPSDADLGALLSEAVLSGPGVDDVEPWLGDTAAFGLRGVEDGEPSGVFAVQVTDEKAARATLAKVNVGSREVTYEGVEFNVDEDGAANGVVDGFVVAANSEENFKAAIDAQGGDSMADDAAYAEALDDAEDDRLFAAYVDPGGVVDLLAETGAIPPDSLELLQQTPGYDPDQPLVVTLGAEPDALTLDASTAATAPETGEAPDVADLPAEAWLAIAGALPGAALADSFEQSIAAAGDLPPEAQQVIDRIGLRQYLASLEAATLRVGGTTVFDLNGSAELIGTDAGAASAIVREIAAELKRQGAPVESVGANATLRIGPYEFTLAARDGNVRLSVGEEAEFDLDDDEGFDAARERLDLDDVLLYADFGPIAELVKTLPDATGDEELAVLEELGTLIVGTEADDDGTKTRIVLTLG